MYGELNWSTVAEEDFRAMLAYVLNETIEGQKFETPLLTQTIEDEHWRMDN